MTKTFGPLNPKFNPHNKEEKIDQLLIKKFIPETEETTDDLEYVEFLLDSCRNRTKELLN